MNNNPKSKFAQNIAIIPDGNRRYAQMKSISLPKAYTAGVSKVNQVANWALEEKLKSMTFWALSLENLQKRSSIEITMLYRLMEKQIDEALKSEEFTSKDIKVNFFGKKELLPVGLIKKLNKLEEKTLDNNLLELNVAIAYSGQDELLTATKSIATDIINGKLSLNDLNSIDNLTFQKYLYLDTLPDLIIRTGKVQRLSGFLPFQSAYSEYYFCQSLWPEFTRTDFSNALEFYKKTNRRFGK